MHHGQVSFERPLCSLAAYALVRETPRPALRDREAVAGTGIFLAVIISAVLWVPPALMVSYLFN